MGHQLFCVRCTAQSLTTAISFCFILSSISLSVPYFFAYSHCLFLVVTQNTFSIGSGLTVCIGKSLGETPRANYAENIAGELNYQANLFKVSIFTVALDHKQERKQHYTCLVGLVPNLLQTAITRKLHLISPLGSLATQHSKLSRSCL